MSSRAPSKRTQRGSVRQTVFLLYALILLVTFSVFSGSVYYYSRHAAYGKVDALLDARASGLEDSIRTYLKTSEPQAPTGWARFFASAEPKSEDRFPDIADFLTEKKMGLNDGQMAIFMDIFDAEGDLIASSNAPPPMTALNAEILKRVRRGERTFYTYAVPGQSAAAPVRSRALMRPLIEKGQLLYLVQTRASLRAVQAELDAIARSLVILVAVTLFFASWAGFLLVKVALHPVDHMVRKIRNIGPADLSVRLDLPDANDEIRALAHTFNEMLSHIERSFAAQKHVMQDLSHELKTPLTIMRGQLGVALKKKRPAEDYEAVLSSNLEEVAKMKRIIDDLLMIARFDSHVAALDFRPLELRALVRSALDDIRVLADEKAITASLSAPSDVPITANEIHLRRLFSNLLDNAVKYTPRGGSIRVRLDPWGTGVWVRITDSGIGIQPDQLPHVFDRFYRGDKERRADGHGLGLSIVKSIVDAHKGEIRIESKPGEGTSIHIFFHRAIPTSLF